MIRLREVGVKPTKPDLIAIIQELRDYMNRRLDTLAAAVLVTEAPASASPHRRRVAYRGAIIPTDIDRAKAQAALRRMGIKP